ncbi:acetyl-coenzyme A synthetase 2-like, mitochondrial isoform X1 [Sander lucioperca]|uniref:acetyl-coenzyme A synthetase 2-like, mitochondrial isoform X1 n=1 Tax=Sander lucioperca TaxID=283035 RepID=UPI0016537747|nr:acetyl-coenzyme A synthetase 2-like, mitochondrial isoform X1 [Sander lucioperca]XP_035851653.1 acetyl-coenzyme A synthetase 2-like, mitochondrial isoform X1 [Sander lucioperca]
MWLSCGCASKYVVSFSRRVFKSYFHVLGRWRCNVPAFMPEAAGFEGVCGHSALQEFSVSNSASFWAAAARQRLNWISPFHTTQDCDLSRGEIKWFEGGKLNVSVNCLDRHVHTCPERVALIWERDEPGSEVKITYRQLLEMTCRLGNMLRRRGVRKGDCVTIYMPPCPLAVASMLACARIGAAHNVVFAGFSAEALAERIRDAQSSTVITVNQGVRGGKVTELKKAVDTALQSCPTVQQVFVAMRTENPVAMTARDIVMEEEMQKEDLVCEPAAMDSEDVLFLLYTSGSTGKPKGLVHTQAGYLLYAALTHKYVFNYSDGDVFGCVADIGWITGHSYSVYGPLANGGTTVLFESTPIYPDPGRYWEMVQRLKINQFYGAPTALRLLLKYGDQWVHKYDRSTLKTLGSVGEPINTEAWEWYHRVVGDGRCPVVDTWWQTETGGICITPRPSEPDAEIVPGMAMRPFFGIEPVLMDTEGKVLTSNDTSGALCIAQPWPGMARTIHNDHQRFTETYCQPYPGYFFTGDGAYRSKEGYYQITGRLDDVINVCGHRIGTAEIEDVVNQYSAVAESAIIGYPHNIKGQGVYAFVVLKKGVNAQEEELSRQLNNMVSKKIAKYACPDFIQFVHRLPKTRSGKIMRRVLRKVVEQDLNGLGDLSTLDDPAAVEEIIQGHRELCSKQQP